MERELIDHPDDPEAAPPPTLPQRDDDVRDSPVPDDGETAEEGNAP